MPFARRHKMDYLEVESNNEITVIITSERLQYRPIEQDDIERIYEGLSHPKVIPHYGVSFSTIEATQEQMDWYADLHKNQKGAWFALLEIQSGDFVGAGGFNDWDHEHAKAEIGFWLLPEYWGLGYMQEGMKRLCNYGFDTMKLHRIEGFVDAGNKNCKKAMAKLPFTHEGCMKDCERKNGEWVSVDIFAAVAPSQI